MAIEVHEKNESRPLKDNQETTYEFFVTGTSDSSEAIEAVRQYIQIYITPPTGMVPLAPIARVVKADASEDNSRIDVSVDYVNGNSDYPELAKLKQIEDYSNQLSFNFATANSNTMYVANATTAYPSAGAPDFKGAINVVHDSDGKLQVNGLPVDEMAGSFSISVTRPNVTMGYLRTLMRAMGKVNSDGIWGFSAGELRFTGVSGTQNSSSGAWQISYTFAVSENQTGLTVGGISGISKKGWEYMWPYFEYEKDSTAKILVKKPKVVYVQQVFKTTAFSSLEIGST